MKINLVDFSSLYLKQVYFPLPENFSIFLVRISPFMHSCKYILYIFKNDLDISWELFLPGRMSHLPKRRSGCLQSDGKNVDLRVLLLTAECF